MAVWGYYQPEEPKIVIGKFGSHSYSWGDHQLDFIRCKNCGCVSHYETKPGQSSVKIAVNFGLDRELVKEVPRRYFNGAEEL
jgi:hypothetical protein